MVKMWIPYQLISLFAATQQLAKRSYMIPVNQPTETVLCQYGDAMYPVPAELVQEAHLQAMTSAYQTPNVQGFPSIIQRSRIEDSPKWNTVMRQVPVAVPSGPKLSHSPFRVLFSEPEAMRAGKDGNVAIISSFWEVVSFETPSSKGVICT